MRLINYIFACLFLTIKVPKTWIPYCKYCFTQKRLPSRKLVVKFLTIYSITQSLKYSKYEHKKVNRYIKSLNSCY